mmetsp:Transcript_6997/g.15037  ORF Transcript_6997/g.15037 Transcript_6997/m.15037 type:complete len:88 (+) Transcript_6997:26-289(+)
MEKWSSLWSCMVDKSAKLTAEPPGRVLVHCRHGHSRSATVAMAYLLRCHPTRFPDVEAAVAHCRARRPRVRPNDGFWAQLQRFADER